MWERPPKPAPSERSESKGVPGERSSLSASDYCRNLMPLTAVPTMSSMGYQALLFCPDEKTSRAVTQVLSELEFGIVPCTEPFAAVKKMMGERFDAVVVDCDNEQNATLLFKSAHNSPNNQTSLAVAVVEGQAGVAKAFRIGANLVLTKPINVEQAKGTLRVARGLLRKNEAAKSSVAPGTPAVKPVSPSPVPAKSTTAVASAATPRPVRPAMPPIEKPASMPSMPVPLQKATPAAKTAVPIVREEPDDEIDIDILDDSEDVASPPAASPIATQVRAPFAVTGSQISAKAEPSKHSADTKPSNAAFGGGLATAPAPARERKPAFSASEEESSRVVPSKPFVDAHAATEMSPKTEPAGPPVSLTFGGAVGEGTQSARGSSKRPILAVAAVVVLAAAAYGAWMQWGHPSSVSNTVRHGSAQPAPVSSSSGSTTAQPPVSTAPDSLTASSASLAPSTQPLSTKTLSEKPGAGVNAPTHPAKKTDEAEESSPSISETKAAHPIVIKGGESKPAAKPAKSDAAAPSLEGITVADAPQLPSLPASSGKAPAPVLQDVHVSQGVAQGILLKRVAPVYPPNALRLRIEGNVQLLATISPAGNVTAVKIVSGDTLLAHAAVDAVKQWKYKPYLLNGTPVETEKPITVEFKLPQ